VGQKIALGAYTTPVCLVGLIGLVFGTAHQLFSDHLPGVECKVSANCSRPNV